MKITIKCIVFIVGFFHLLLGENLLDYSKSVLPTKFKSAYLNVISEAYITNPKIATIASTENLKNKSIVKLQLNDGLEFDAFLTEYIEVDNKQYSWIGHTNNIESGEYVIF